MTTLDMSGRLIAATNLVIAFGQAPSPFVVGLFAAETTADGVIDHSPALTTGLIGFACRGVLFTTLVKSNGRSLMRNRLLET